MYPNISIDNNDIITRPQSSTFFLYIFFEIFFFLCNYSTVTAGSINKTRKPVVVVPAYNNNRVRPIDEHFASGPFLDQFDNTLDGLSNITYNNITSDHSYNPYFTCVSSGWSLAVRIRRLQHRNREPVGNQKVLIFITFFLSNFLCSDFNQNQYGNASVLASGRPVDRVSAE